MVICDLHTHSTASDGAFSPKKLIEIAKERKIEYLALTDHDTVSGLEEASIYATQAGITFIPGIELSTLLKNESIHLLGYFKDDSYKNPSLIEFLDQLKRNRVIRAEEIVRKLKKYHNIEITLESVLENGKDTIARPHIARAIIKAGYPYTQEYIFDNFLGDNCPAYIPSNKIPTAEGIALLKKHNALVFLAHPTLLKRTPIENLMDIGLDGIEAIYPLNKKGHKEKFMKLAIKNNLLISCGSDSHGLEETDSKHGKLGSMSIEKEAITSFLNRLSIK